MRFGDTPRELKLRAAVGQFLAAELPSEWTDLDTFGLTAELIDIVKRWAHKLRPRGWVAPGLPPEYGGAGLASSPTELFVFYEEMARGGAPGADVLGTVIVAPTILRFGTDEQKARFLPPIADGEVWWTQLFSEPNSGSDLAGLRAKAERDGDHYIVNGEKIWNSGAHCADWGALLARTDPESIKHHGISFLAVDMRCPGIEVRPIYNLVGSHSFNQVYFRDVRVPITNRFGEEGEGWYTAIATLDFERGARGTHVGTIMRTIDKIVVFARQLGAGHLSEALRTSIAMLAIDAQIAYLLSYRVVEMQASGQIPNAEASAAKVFIGELQQRVAETALRVAGLAGLRVDKRVMGKAAPSLAYCGATAYTIAGGTSEIQRNILASRGLSLPRG